jgi:hypothetical protein
MTLSVSILFGQVTCGYIAIPEDWNFDGGITPYDYLLKIDTTSNPNNVWQIGAPQKTIISSAYSTPNLIITDTINHYPPNDTSVFIFKHIDNGGYSYHHSAELAGYYKVNSDSLNDYGTIEISLDKGTTWVNLITDTVYSDYYYWQTEKPTLTGNSDGWKNFWVRLEDLGIVFPIEFGDTILIKFTFISDAIENNLDGLAYDNFQFCDGWEGIEEVKDNSLIEIYPNPTNNLLFIVRKKQPKLETIQLYTYSGQLLFEDGNFKSNFIDTRQLNLPLGLYFLKYSTENRISIKSFIVGK